MAGKVKRDWGSVPVIQKWVAARKTDGAHLRAAVWEELEPMRAALSQQTGSDNE